EALETGSRALDFARESGAMVLAERADVLCAFALLHRGSTLAASTRFEHLTDIARDPEASLTAHVGLGRVAQLRGELDLARWLFIDSLAKARALDLRTLEGICLNGLGGLAKQEGEFDDAARYIGDSLEVFERMGHRVRVADCLNDLAELARLRGEYARAMKLCQRSIATFESAESRLSNRARLQMAYVSLGLKEFQRAHVLLERLSLSFHDAGDVGHLAMAVVGTLPILAWLGSTKRLLSSLEQAKKLLEVTDRRDRDVAYALEMVRDITRTQADADTQIDALVSEILERHAPLRPEIHTLSVERRS
ncbi:MAG: tetratricopeptide repeat protein, partial [Myxococcota bacterium]